MSLAERQALKKNLQINLKNYNTFKRKYSQTKIRLYEYNWKKILNL